MSLAKTVNKKSRFKQGFYTPKNPEKYTGDLEKIRYMSSWELNFMHFLDNNPNILRWVSEGIAIPYFKRLSGKVHKYYPDMLIEYKNKDGNLIQELIEIKPAKDCRPSRSKKPKTKLYENLTFSVNVDKWTAAKKWCDERGIVFTILSEHELFK
jgi:hypothetical protein